MPSVLIIGGGFAGLAAAKALLKSPRFEVTLVDRKDYFEVTPAQIHQLVAPQSLGDRPRFFYREALDRHFLQGEVVALEPNAAVLANGQRLTFDTLILAPGTRYPRLALAKPTDHVSLGQRRGAVAQLHQEYQKAPAYLIIGGGLVGVELAGELATQVPRKPVRLAHRGPRLAENLSPEASAEALAQLRELGVMVELNTGSAQPRNGEVVFDATSPEPATGFLASLSPSVLDARGAIQVNDRLQVKGFPHWYAVGDANNVVAGKQAAVAIAQGEHVAKVLLGADKPYRPQATMAIVPLGATHGFSQLPFGVVRWKFLLNMKRKDYLIGMFRKKFGAA